MEYLCSMIKSTLSGHFRSSVIARSQLAREHFALELRALLKNQQSICASSDGTDASESSTVQLIRFLKMQMTTVRII